VDRLTRHELKTDKFVEEVGQTVHFLEEHRQAVIRYGSIALALLVIAAAAYGYLRTKHAERQAALSRVLETYNTPIMDPPPAEMVAFRTEKDRSDAVVKGCNEIISKHAGSEEAAVATMILGNLAADQGDLDSAERYYKQAAEKAGRDFASLARYSLAQLYASQGKQAEAEKILRSLADKPTTLVTREQAQLELARVLSRNNPEEARKIAGPLANKTGAVGRAAVNLLADINRKLGS